MYRRILVPLDGSATADRGLQEALGLGRQIGAQLVLLHVIDDCPVLAETAPATAYLEAIARLRARGQELLAAAGRRVAEAGLAAPETQLREVTRERTGDAIVAVARASGCDLIVMGSHGRRGFDRLALGSDAERVVRTSPVPVLLVRAPGPPG